MAKSIMKRPRRSMDVNTIAHTLVDSTAHREGKTPKALEFEEQFHGRPVTEEYIRSLAGEPEAVKSNPDVSAYMSAIGRKGGKVGGKRRLKTMTAEQRKKSAQKAAKARWKKKH